MRLGPGAAKQYAAAMIRLLDVRGRQRGEHLPQEGGRLIGDAGTLAFPRAGHVQHPHLGRSQPVGHLAGQRGRAEIDHPVRTAVPLGQANGQFRPPLGSPRQRMSVASASCTLRSVRAG